MNADGEEHEVSRIVNALPEPPRQFVHEQTGDVDDRHDPEGDNADRERQFNEWRCAIVRRNARDEDVCDVEFDERVKREGGRVNACENDRQGAQVLVNVLEPTRVVEASKHPGCKQHAPHHRKRHQTPRNHGADSADVPPDVRVVHE